MIRLANTPARHVTSKTLSVLDMFRVNCNSINMHRPIPAPEPDPEPNPAPDEAPNTAYSNIPSDDWDELFYVIQARLMTIAKDANKSQGKVLVWADGNEKKVMLECVEAMTLLHRALRHDRQAQQKC